jgi:hypothetical protein
MKRLTLLTLCAIALHAQTVKEYDFHLDNGAEVLYQTYAEADAKDPAPNLGTARAFDNTIERNIMDPQYRQQLAFDLRIEKLPGDPIRFRVSMGPPLGGWGFFGQTAPPREVQNGDRVMLDVLEQPGTKRKIVDSFQVGIGVGMHAMPVAKTIPKTPPAGTAIHLQGACTIDGATPSRGAAIVHGDVLAVSIPGRGVFFLSTAPGAGYRMEGIAEGNMLMFVAGSDRFDIQCPAPVVAADGAGAWYLWVRPAPADMPKKPLGFFLGDR